MRSIENGRSENETKGKDISSLQAHKLARCLNSAGNGQDLGLSDSNFSHLVRVAYCDCRYYC
jgi:hypothetical protein